MYVLMYIQIHNMVSTHPFDVYGDGSVVSEYDVLGIVHDGVLLHHCRRAVRLSTVCMYACTCMYVVCVCMNDRNLFDLSTNIFYGVFHEYGRVGIALGHLRLTYSTTAIR